MTLPQSLLLCNHFGHGSVLYMKQKPIENICIHVVTSHQVPTAQPCSLSAIFRHFWPHIRSFPFGSSLEIYKRPPTTSHEKKPSPTKIIKHQFHCKMGFVMAHKWLQHVFKGSLIARCYKRGWPWCFGATYWSVTNLDILSPRSHGNNPDQCIPMCSHQC